jgi:hypothetical protein
MLTGAAARVSEAAYSAGLLITFEPDPPGDAEASQI